MSQVATWVCIARHESEYNTAAVNHGSGDHGLFQISNLFWCSPPGDGYACGLSCSDLEDDDIEDDVICAKRIHREHTRLSGDGFNAWVVYGSHCKGQDLNKYIDGCFRDDKTLEQYNFVEKQIKTKPYTTTPQKIVSTTTAYRKVYPKTSVATTTANPFLYQSRFAKPTYYSRPSTARTENRRYTTTSETPTTTRRYRFKSVRNNIFNNDKHKSIEHSTGSRYKYHINKSGFVLFKDN